MAFQSRVELTAPLLADLAGLDDAGFRAVFSASPVKRVGRARFVRNVLIAIGNSGDPALVAPAHARLDDAEPVVRGAAVWALGRLLRSEEHTSELQSLMRISYAVFCLKKKK